VATARSSLWEFPIRQRASVPDSRPWSSQRARIRVKPLTRSEPQPGSTALESRSGTAWGKRVGGRRSCADSSPPRSCQQRALSGLCRGDTAESLDPRGRVSAITVSACAASSGPGCQWACTAHRIPGATSINRSSAGRERDRAPEAHCWQLSGVAVPMPQRGRNASVGCQVCSDPPLSY